MSEYKRGIQSMNSITLSFDRTYDKYDWGRIIEKRMPEMYPDLQVKLERQENKILLHCSFKNRPTSETDVRNRFFNFMKLYPALKVSNFQLLTVQGKCLS